MDFRALPRRFVESPASCSSLLGALALAVAYATTVVPDFILLDGATMLDDAYLGRDGAALHALELGRPLIWATAALLYDQFDTISSIKYIRMLGLAATLLVFALFYRFVFCRFFSALEAWCLALTMCLLGPFVMVAYWAVLPALPVGCALACGAMILIRRAVDGPLPPDARPLQGMLCVRWRPLAGAGLFAFLAVFAYQPSAFIALLLPLLHVLRPSERNTLAATLRVYAATLGAFAAGSLGFFIAWKAYRQLLFEGRDLGKRDLANPVQEIAAKLDWFFLDGLPTAASLFRLNTSSALAAVVLVLCLGQFLVLRCSWRERAVRAMLWAALVPVAYLPNLLAAENHTSLRSQIAIQPFLWVSVFCALMALSDRVFSRFTGTERLRVLRGSALLAASVALLLNQLLVRGPAITRSHVEELRVTRDAVAVLLARGDVQRVVIVRAGRGLELAPFARGPISRPTAAPHWSAVSQFRIVYVDATRELPAFEIVQIAPEELAGFEAMAGDHVIDFDRLLRDRFKTLQQPVLPGR